MCANRVQYEVAVVGGGIAGVAAAVQAARRGRKTVLIEKTVFPGGLATTGLVFIYLPLCDGYGTQVLFGLAEELLLLSMKYGPGEIPPDWRQSRPGEEHERFRIPFSPAAFVLAMDELLEREGVDIWYDTLCCAARLDDGRRLRGIEVENKSGRIRIEAECFVDASGDADVARQAGVPCHTGENMLSIWELNRAPGTKQYASQFSDDIGLFVGNWKDRNFSGIDGKLVSRHLLESRGRLRAHYAALYHENPALRHEHFSLVLPAMADFRMTYAIHGRTLLDESNADAVFADSVGLSNDWRQRGPIRELSYGALLPEVVDGLLAAGRCIAAVGDAWDQTRVIPIAAVTGQAAGLAAALAVEAGCGPAALPVETLRRELRILGIPLHREELEELNRKKYQ